MNPDYRADGSYAIRQDGTTMSGVAPTNVVIQYVSIKQLGKLATPPEP